MFLSSSVHQIVLLLVHYFILRDYRILGKDEPKPPAQAGQMQTVVNFVLS